VKRGVLFAVLIGVLIGWLIVTQYSLFVHKPQWILIMKDDDDFTWIAITRQTLATSSKSDMRNLRLSYDTKEDCLHKGLRVLVEESDTVATCVRIP